MMTGSETREVPAAAAGEEGEEGRSLLEGMAVLDFDMLCSTVAVQAQKGTWGKLNGSNEEEEEAVLYRNNESGGGILRMWEGELIYDCFDDRQIALESTCCPCYRFGRNMKRAGFGSCFLQGFFYSVLVVIALANLLAFIIIRRRCFLYLAMAFTLSVGAYVGCFRSQIRRKFNIKEFAASVSDKYTNPLPTQGGDSSMDDCVYHMICPCCTLSQESRTLEMNNVQDGIWHGRSETICVGNYTEANKALFGFTPPSPVATKSPEHHTMQKTSSNHLPTSVVGSSPLVPPSD